jgi:hypothetical protein
MTVLDSDGDEILVHDAPMIGTGMGTDVRIWFTPAMWADKSRGPASAPDEVLLHELIHASRQVSGVSRRDHVGKYTNEEEFIAIMIDNIYLSEKTSGVFGAATISMKTAIMRRSKILTGFLTIHSI